jgi:hypothetical protein
MTLSALKQLLRVFLFVPLLGIAPVLAQVSFNDFSTPAGLQFNGVAAAPVVSGSNKVLRITPSTAGHSAGSAWFTTQQSISGGFTSVFQFQVTTLSESPTADGFAFVIQNSPASESTGGIFALGGAAGALGYGQAGNPGGDAGNGIQNSLAVEFDNFANNWDPDGNHVAVQSCSNSLQQPGPPTVPPGSNNQFHVAVDANFVPVSQSSNPVAFNSCTLGSVISLGSLPTPITLADGNPHTVVVDYDPGTLRIFVDNNANPILVVSVDLTAQLSLSGGNAFVGFTGGTGGLTQNSDILNWTFTPSGAATTIAQPLNPTGATGCSTPPCTNYQFGNYNQKYSNYLTSNSDALSVTAIPISQATFAATLNGQFPGASCIIYDGTGGKCVKFDVTCNSASVDCSTLPYDVSQNFNDFNTGSPTITGAGILKREITPTVTPYTNIIENFSQGRLTDGGGKGHTTGFSEFVMCQNCTAPPTITVNPLPVGGTYLIGQSVTFSCATDPNAPLVTLTGCNGSVTGNGNLNGNTLTFNQLGPGALTVNASDSVLNTNNKVVSYTVIAPQLSVSPTSINLGNVKIFNLLWKNVTLKNTGTLPVLISNISLTRIQADWDDFFILPLCPYSLAPGKNCIILVGFLADDLGPRSATLNITDNALGSPQQVSLTANVVKR